MTTYTIKRTNKSGVVTEETYSVSATFTDADNARYGFFARIGAMFAFADTNAVEIIKIVSSSAGELLTVAHADFNKETPVQIYRIVIKGETFSGRHANEVKEYRATSAADAMLKFWNHIKENGAGFCGVAASIINAEFEVQTRTPTETVLFEPVTTADETISRAVAARTVPQPATGVTQGGAGTRGTITTTIGATTGRFGEFHTSINSITKMSRIVRNGRSVDLTPDEVRAEVIRLGRVAYDYNYYEAILWLSGLLDVPISRWENYRG